MLKPIDGWTARMDLCGVVQTGRAVGVGATWCYSSGIRGGLVFARLRAMKMPIGLAKGGLMVVDAG